MECVSDDAVSTHKKRIKMDDETETTGETHKKTAREASECDHSNDDEGKHPEEEGAPRVSSILAYLGFLTTKRSKVVGKDGIGDDDDDSDDEDDTDDDDVGEDEDGGNESGLNMDDTDDDDVGEDEDDADDDDVGEDKVGEHNFEDEHDGGSESELEEGSQPLPPLEPLFPDRVRRLIRRRVAFRQETDFGVDKSLIKSLDGGGRGGSRGRGMDTDDEEDIQPVKRQFNVDFEQQHGDFFDGEFDEDDFVDDEAMTDDDEDDNEDDKPLTTKRPRTKTTPRNDDEDDPDDDKPLMTKRQMMKTTPRKEDDSEDEDDSAEDHDSEDDNDFVGVIVGHDYFDETGGVVPDGGAGKLKLLVRWSNGNEECDQHLPLLDVLDEDRKLVEAYVLDDDRKGGCIELEKMDDLAERNAIIEINSPKVRSILHKQVSWRQCSDCNSWRVVKISGAEESACGWGQKERGEREGDGEGTEGKISISDSPSTACPTTWTCNCEDAEVGVIHNCNVSEVPPPHHHLHTCHHHHPPLPS
jgi:hypothetical protein